MSTSEPMSTSLGTLNSHDWAVLSSRWARGVDWMVTKIGKKWYVPDILGGISFRTKREAGEFCSNLILMEARHRAWGSNKDWEAQIKVSGSANGKDGRLGI